MPPLFKLALLTVIAVCAMQMLRAQDLAPRAYIITPLHSNAVTLTWSFYDGGLNFNGTIPITDATGTYNVPVFSYYHSFSFFGRSANITASLPYAGKFLGKCVGRTKIDLPFRLAGFLGTALREPQGRSSNARADIHEMETEGAAGR